MALGTRVKQLLQGGWCGGQSPAVEAGQLGLHQQWQAGEISGGVAQPIEHLGIEWVEIHPGLWVGRDHSCVQHPQGRVPVEEQQIGAQPGPVAALDRPLQLFLGVMTDLKAGVGVELAVASLQPAQPLPGVGAQVGVDPLVGVHLHPEVKHVGQSIAGAATEQQQRGQHG